MRQGKCYLDKSPGSKSVLNEIGAQGLLSYDDFCFLITLLSTPPRYIDTAFNLFDVTGDGNIEAKVDNKMLFAHSIKQLLHFRSLHLSAQKWLRKQEVLGPILKLNRSKFCFPTQDF